MKRNRTATSRPQMRVRTRLISILCGLMLTVAACSESEQAIPRVVTPSSNTLIAVVTATPMPVLAATNAATNSTANAEANNPQLLTVSSESGETFGIADTVDLPPNPEGPAPIAGDQVTPTATITVTVTVTVTPTGTLETTPTPTPPDEGTPITPTITVTVTVTVTSTGTPEATPTPTPPGGGTPITPTITPTGTIVVPPETPEPTATPAPPIIVSPTVTLPATPVASPTLTATATPVNILGMTATVPSTVTPAVTHMPAGIPGAEGITLRASELLGRSVEDRQGQEIGAVEDVLLDLGDGRIDYAVLSFNDTPDNDMSDDFAGLSGRWVVVPLDAFRLDTQGVNKGAGVLVLAVEGEFLAAAPSFEAGRLPDMTNPAWDEELLQYWEEMR